MKKRCPLLAAVCMSLLLSFQSQAQHVIVVVPWAIAGAMFPEHGFLPGKKFTFYPTIEKYDLGGKKMRVELYDQRDSLQLTMLECSMVELNNKSEFAGAAGTHTVQAYFAQLLPQANITLDSAAADTLKVYLEAMDSRLIGFGNITAHGLCRMRMEYPGWSKTYCIDLTDKDSHSPISSHAFVTRKTATRVIQSAAIREVIEKILIDLKAAMPSN